MPYFIKTGMFNGTIPGKSWLIRKIGFDFLDPEYVAHEIIRCIEYEIRDLIIPDVIRISTISGWFLPYFLRDWGLINLGCSLQHFVGRNNNNNHNNKKPSDI